MAYLATFHWGWLLASLLLGLAMGWIAVVHRGQGVSKLTRGGWRRWRRRWSRPRWPAVIPGRPGYWLDLGLVMFARLSVPAARWDRGCAHWVVSRVTLRRIDAGARPDRYRPAGMAATAGRA